MKKILICTLICLLSAVAFAQEFETPPRSVTGAFSADMPRARAPSVAGTPGTISPSGAQKLYLWPAFDCNVVPEVYVLRGATDSTAVKKDGSQIKIFGAYPADSALEAEIDGALKLACPVRLPANSRISNVWVKGSYYGASGPTVPPRQAYLGIQIHDLEGEESVFIGRAMSPLYSIRFGQNFSVKGPEVPTYLLVETYSINSITHEKQLFHGGWVDINLIEIEYVAP